MASFSLDMREDVDNLGASSLARRATPSTLVSMASGESIAVREPMSPEELSSHQVARYQKMRQHTQVLSATMGAASADAEQATLQGVPTVLLAEVLAYLDEVDVTERVFRLNRQLRLRVCAPGAVRTLKLELALQTARAAGALGPAAWNSLHSLHVVAGAVPPHMEHCLGWLGASLRDLHFEAFARAPEYGLQTLSPLVWPTLRTCNYVVKKDLLSTASSTSRDQRPVARPSFAVDRKSIRLEAGAAPDGLTLPALERLGLCCTALDLAAPGASGRHVSRFLVATVGGRLRVLSLSVPVVTSEMLDAMGPIAPALEALHLHERVARFHTHLLPPLPRVHTLALTCSLNNEGVLDSPYTLAATPHRALRHLHLSGGVKVQVAAEGEGWAVDTLHSLVYDVPQDYDRLLALLEPACHTLRVLSCYTEAAPPKAHADFTVAALRERVEGLASLRERVEGLASLRESVEGLASLRESVWCRVGPLIGRAASALQDLSVQFEGRLPVVTRAPAVHLGLEVDKWPALHTLRLSTPYLPPREDSVWERVRNAPASSLRRVILMEPSIVRNRGVWRPSHPRSFFPSVGLPHVTMFRQHFHTVERPHAFAGLATAYHGAVEELVEAPSLRPATKAR